MRHKTNVNSSGGGGGGSIGVDLTVLWFYGVRPWPVAPSPPPSSSPGTHGAEKSPRARLGVGGMRDGQIAVGPLAPRSHAFLTAPLAPPRSLLSRASLSPPRSLDLSLSHSLFLAPPFPRTDTRSLYTSTRTTLHLIPLPSLSLVYIYIYVHMTQIHATNEDFVSFSSSFPAYPFFFCFFFSFSDSILSPARAHTRIREPLLSSFSRPFSLRPPVPRVSLDAREYMYVRACVRNIYARAHDRRHSLSASISLSLSFFADPYSRARPNPLR